MSLIEAFSVKENKDKPMDNSNTSALTQEKAKQVDEK
jgi:hypothetical protein